MVTMHTRTLTLLRTILKLNNYKKLNKNIAKTEKQNGYYQGTSKRI